MGVTVEGELSYSLTLYLTNVNLVLTGFAGRQEDLEISGKVEYNGSFLLVTINDYGLHDIEMAATRVLLDKTRALVEVKEALLKHAKKLLAQGFINNAEL